MEADTLDSRRSWGSREGQGVLSAPRAHARVLDGWKGAPPGAGWDHPPSQL